MPDSLMSIPLYRAEDIEEKHPGLGYISNYWSEQKIISVVFYDYGEPKLSDQILRAHFDRAVGDIVSVEAKRGGEMSDPVALSFHEQQGVVKYFARLQDKQDRWHAVTMGLAPGCMVKIRLTSDADQEGMQIFLFGLAQNVEKHLLPN